MFFVAVDNKTDGYLKRCWIIANARQLRTDGRTIQEKENPRNLPLKWS